MVTSNQTHKQTTLKHHLPQQSKNWENTMHNRQTHFKRSKLEDAFLKLNTSKYHSQGLLATLPLIFHLFSDKLFNNSAITLKLAQNDPKLLYFASKTCTWQISTILIGTLWEWPHQVLPSLLPSNTASG